MMWRLWGALLLFSLLPAAAGGMEFPGPPVKAAAAVVEADSCRLENGVICMSWRVVRGRLRPGPVIDRMSGKTVPPGGEAFSIVLNDGRIVRASDLRITGAVAREDLPAEAAAWSRDNADVLVDTHWIGGDAGKSEPYGYASWSPRKGILCLRNPSRQAKSLSLKLVDAFELPSDAPRQYALKSPWKADAGLPAQSLAAEADYRIELQPFEVRVLEAIPRRPSSP
jgi:hypothetical protein